MINITNVYKSIDKKDILKNINLKVNKGSIFGLIGENGAGKTTLIKSIVGIYKTSSGTITINGKKVFENNNIKQHIAYVADENNYPHTFSVKELIEFYEKTYKNFSINKFNKLNSIFNIPLNKRIGSLSKGMKMRTVLMLNLSINPDILILDEPTSGLDALAKRELMNILMDEVAERNTTILISSHHLNDIERICDTVAIIKNGEITYCDSIEEIKGKIKKLQVVFKNNDSALKTINSWSNILKIESLGRVNYIITSNYSNELEKDLFELGAEFVEPIDLSLEDMFIYSIKEDKSYEKSLE